MTDTWKTLEHTNPNYFSREDYEVLMMTVLQGLQKRHGDLEPEFAYIRSQEQVTNRDGEVQTVNIPRLTVCYLNNSKEGKRAVGLAFCCRNDNPNKAYAKSIALKRAVLALLRREDKEENVIREETEFSHFLKEVGIQKNVKSFTVNSLNYTILPKKDKKDHKCQGEQT